MYQQPSDIYQQTAGDSNQPQQGMYFPLFMNQQGQQAVQYLTGKFKNSSLFWLSGINDNLSVALHYVNRFPPENRDPHIDLGILGVSVIWKGLSVSFHRHTWNLSTRAETAFHWWEVGNA